MGADQAADSNHAGGHARGAFAMLAAQVGELPSGGNVLKELIGQALEIVVKNEIAFKN